MDRNPAPARAEPRLLTSDSPRLSLFCLIVLGGIYLAGFLRANSGLSVLSGAPPVWHENFDQAWYWRSAEAFWHGDLSAGEHWYPPLYSLLMAPLAWLGEARAELVVGLGLYLTSFAAFAVIARSFAVPRPPAALLFGLATFWLDGMARAWTWPWTTTLSGALILSAMALTLQLRRGEDSGDEPEPDRKLRWNLLLLGALLAAIPCARPVDGIVSLALGLFAAWQLLIVKRDWPGAFTVAAGGLAILLPYLALYLSIWGADSSPYARMSAVAGFSFRDFGWKIYVLLIEPRPWYPSSVAILDRMPWLLLAGGGLLAGLFRPKSRWLTLVIGLPMTVYLVTMVGYRSLVPSGLWMFGLIHYFKWIILLCTLLAWQFCARFRSAPNLSMASLAIVFALSCIQFQPVQAQPDEEAKLLVFAKRLPLADHFIYLGEIVVVDRAGRQRNYFEVQAVSEGQDQIKVIALDRNFAGQERVEPLIPYPGQVRVAKGGRVDGITSAAMYGPMIGRYRPTMRFGLPCWLPAYSCPARELPAER